MKTLKFKCTLKSDVILNVKSASEGQNQTLDFIPGNCFLGMVAANGGYDAFGQDALTVFHSGKVRFGDAHPMIDSMRTLKVPASMFYPKMKKLSDKCYIHHFYDIDKDTEDNGHRQQLKQCRNGFYAFSGNVGKHAECKKSYAIKSAYDSENRRSRDNAMYGYESLREGMIFCFSVEIEVDVLAERIADRLVGDKRLGRSRTAQYGWVNIERVNDYIESASNKLYDGGLVTVYADSRLIFLDEYGQPTFQPTIKDLGLESGTISFKKSQIRTFQYAPWNFHRQAYDADRCGIEKGSVFVIEGCTDKLFESKYIGSFNNEGFGRVIYNPDFLLPKDGTNGEAKYTLKETLQSSGKYSKEPLSDGSLLEYLNRQKSESDIASGIYSEVNDFVEKNSYRFTGERFASQWGTIRSIAMTIKTKEGLRTALFAEKSGYLTHGVAAEKWGEQKRLIVFSEFFDKLNENNAQQTIINLASQMAKECKRKND